MVLPSDQNGNLVPLTPASVSEAVTKNDTLTTASLAAITLQALTKIVRVFALDNGVFMKYAATGVTSSVFDEYIPARNVMDFVIPVGVTAISLIADEGTARIRVIEK